MWRIQIINLETGKQRLDALQNTPNLHLLNRITDTALFTRVTDKPLPVATACKSCRQELMDFIKARQEARKNWGKVLKFTPKSERSTKLGRTV